MNFSKVFIRFNVGSTGLRLVRAMGSLAPAPNRTFSHSCGLKMFFNIPRSWRGTEQIPSGPAAFLALIFSSSFFALVIVKGQNGGRGCVFKVGVGGCALNKSSVC